MSTALDCLRERYTHEDEMSVERTLYGAAILLISIISLATNMLLLLVILRTDVMNRFFRFYLLSATSAGLTVLIANFAALSPTILLRVQLSDPANIIISTTDTLGYLTLMFTTTAIATDRFIFFLLPRLNRYLNSAGSVLPCFAAFPWILSLLLTVQMNLYGCYKRTDPYALTYTYHCSDCGFYDPLLYYAGFLFPGVNFILYLSIYCSIVAMRLRISSNIKPSATSNSVRRQEVFLVLQFSLICVIQFGSSAFFYLLPPLTNRSPISFYVSMLFSAMNTMVNPMVIFVFQRRIRNACVTLFTWS
ncbi:hypothetical protein Aduo_004467 [Ancylostoma duodenale]